MVDEETGDSEKATAASEAATLRAGHSDNPIHIRDPELGTWTKRLTFWTAAIVLLAVVNAVISLCQWSAMQGQLEEMKQSFAADRAYVFASFSRDINTGLVPEATVTFSFTNIGKTPADFRGDGGRCAYSYESPSSIDNAAVAGFTDESGKLPLGAIIEIEKSIGPFAYKIDATQSQIDQAKVGVGKIFCLSKVSYDDMRGNNHETEMCMVYNFGIPGWTLYPDKRFNFHT